MVGKNNKQIKNTKEGTKVESYSIKKFKVGAASVVVGASIFFGAGVAAAADTQDNTADKNTTTEKSDATATSDEAPKAVAQPKTETTAKEATTSEVAKAVENKTTKEEVKVDATALNTLISDIKANKEAGDYDKYTEESVKALEEAVKNAEVTAKTATTQEAIDKAIATLTEKAAGLKEKAAKTEEKAETPKETAATEEKTEAAAKEETTTPAKTEVVEAKKELDHLVAEGQAWVPAVAKEATKVEDATAKSNLESAVETVNTKVAEAINVLKNDEATKDDVTKKSGELRSAMEGVVAARTRAGINTPVSAQLGAEDYQTGAVSVIDVSTRIDTSKAATTTKGQITTSGSSVRVNGSSLANDVKTGLAKADSGATTLAEAVKLKFTAQPANSSGLEPGIIYYGFQQTGRDDYPLTKEEYDKLAAEATLWGGKTTASGWSTNQTGTGSGSTYEYLANEIYGYVYEQGQEIAITNVSKRVALSETATAAGWKILGIVPSNLPNGLTYDSKTDTISGKINANILNGNALQNGVFDDRLLVYVTNGSETVRYYLANYNIGWIGWKDHTAPTTLTTDDITNAGGALDTNIHFVDNSGVKTAKPAAYTATEITTRDDGSVTVTRQATTNTAESYVLGVDQIDGISYSKTTGKLSGNASTAGIYTVTTVAKDFADKPNNEWSQSGQEAHESFTITVRPDVKIGNVDMGATEVPVTVSEGSTQITVTLPDGTTVEAAKDSSGNWLITGGTSSTATKGTNIGSGTSIKTPVNASSITTGVDNIKAVVAAENVSATLLVSSFDIKTAEGETATAKFNKETGRWIITSLNGATVTTVDSLEKAKDIANQWVLVSGEVGQGRIMYRTNNDDGTYKVREIQIVSDLSDTNNRGGSTGENKYRTFEFTRTYDSTGTATAVDSKRSDAQTVATAVLVKYDATTGKWTASDGSTVTATPNVTPISTTDASNDVWGHGEDGKDYTAIRSASEMKVEKDGAGESVPVYRDTDSWTISTTSGVSGVVNRVSNKARDYASVTNTLPTAKGTDYSTNLNSTVNLLDPTKVTTADKEDTTPIVTKVTVTAPDGTVTTYEPTAELAVLNNAKAAVLTAQDAYKAATTELSTAVTAKTAADAAATAKNAELATAEGELDAAISEYKIAKAMVDNGNLSGDALAAAQTRLTNAETAQTAASTKVNTLTAELKTLHDNVAAAINTVNEKLATANTTRTELEEKEDELTSAKNAVKAAVTNALSGSDAFKLTQVGKYKVSLSVIDNASNQVLDGATATGTTNGDDTNSGTVVASDVTADYTITVNPFDIVGNNVTSKDIQGATQTGTPTFTFDDTDKSAIDQGTKVYTLDSTEAKDADGKTVGTYSIDSATGEVTFKPNADYVGTPTPATVKLTVTFGTGDDAVTKEATATYTPTVVPVTPEAKASETTGIQGATQNSTIVYNADNNDDSNNTTLNFHQGSTEVNGTTKSVELDKTTVQFVNAEGTAVDTLTVANQGTYTLVKDTDGTVTGVKFVPVATFTGDATPVKVQIKDKNGTAVQTTYTPHVTPVTATGVDKTSTDIQGATQTGTPTFSVSDETNIVKGDDNKPKATYSLDGADATTGKVTVAGEGTYSIDSTTGEVTFEPEKTFVGKATGVTVKATYTLETEDATDTTTAEITATAKYTPTVVGVTPAAKPSETTGVQGATQTSTISYDAEGNNDGDNTTLNFAKGSAVVNNETKSVELDKKSVQFVDANGNAVDTLTVENQGTYSLVKDSEGNVTGVKFTPLVTFTGDATPVNVQIKDVNGTVAKTTYTPHVTPVTASAEPATSTGTQGSTQSGTPTYTAPTAGEGVTVTPTYTLDGADKDGKVVVEGVGTYTIDNTGKVTFVPVASYTGTPTPVKVNVTYTLTTGVEGETPATVTTSTTYTPTVTPVTAEGTPKESTDIQGAVQHGTPEFKVSDETNIVKGDDNKPKATYSLEGADVTTGKVTVAGEGTYTIDPTTGEVTFEPEKTFVGTAKGVTVKATYTLATADETDTTTTEITATAKYTPTVVPVKPTASESSTTGIQGAVQKSEIVLDNKDENVNTLNFNKGTTTVDGKDKSVDLNSSSVTLLDASGKPATSVTVAGQGTYTIVEENGTKFVQFTPVASYTGDVTPVTVQIADANGTTVTTTYTPKIVGVTPIADASETTGKQGQPQTSTIVYDAENNSDGNITTLNLAGGSATVNGTKQTAALDKKSVTLLDASGKPATSVTVAGQGTYTLVKDDAGNVTGVTFTPEADFTGKATPVSVQVTDVNGNTAKTTYTPTVIPNGTVVVNYVDTEGKVIKTPVTTKDLEDGSNYDTTPNRDEKITGTDGTVYYYKKLDDNSAAAKGKVVGKEVTNVTYVYEKAGSVTVNYVDKEGNVIKQPVKDVENGKPGESYDTTDNKPTTITAEDGKTYKLVPNETKGSETGTITSGVDTQVTYTYEEVKGNVVVENYDTKGNKLGETTEVVKETSTGTAYSTKPEEKITVNGKTYFYKEVKSDSAPESGKVKEGTTTVKYVYEEAGSVVVNYTLADGTVIKAKNTTAFKDEKAGTAYSTSTKELKPETITTEDGKTYKLVPTATKGNETGKVVSGETTEVTYIYEEVKGNVVVENYDTKGNKLTSKDVVKDSSTGTDYSTKPEDKITVNGKTYFYKEVKSDSAKETGKVTEGTTTVKYVYEEAGSVTVNYVDEKGNVIKTPQTPVKDEKAGTDYNTNTTTLKPKTIQVGNKKYELVEVKGSETGKVVSGENTQVTYVYKFVPVTKFIEEGTNKELIPQEDGTQPRKTITSYEYVRTITDADGNTVHVYKKVTTPVNPTTDKVTKYVDENGNPVSNTEKGNQPKKDIPGYEYVRTYTDKDGNTVHVYKKVTTPGSVIPTAAKAKELPNTAATNNSANTAAAGAGLIALIAAAVRRRKNNK